MKRYIEILLAGFFLAICIRELPAQVEDARLLIDDASRIYELTGKWKFMPADNLQYAERNFNDSSWNTITVPGSWHIHGYDYDGTAWFRMKFKVAGNVAGRDLKIITPYIDHAVEIYLNGILIGKQGKIAENGRLLESNSRNSVFTVSSSLVDVNGENTLAFRIAGLAGIGGFAFAYFRIGEADLVQNDFYRYLIKISFLSAVFLFVGVYHILLYLWRKKETHYLSFGILSILTGLQQITIKTIGFWIIDNNWVNLYINTFVLASYPYFIMDFMQKFTGLQVRRFFVSGKHVSLALVGALTIIFAGLYADRDFWAPYYGLYWKYAVPVILASIFVYMIYCVYLAWIFAKSGEYSGKILIIGISIYLFFMILGMASYFGLVSLDIMFEYGFFGMIVSMATALAYKFSYVHNEADRLNVELGMKNEQLLRLDKIKDDFLANTSHELRTPLNGIIGIAENMAEMSDCQIDEKSRKNLALIISSARRLSNLVNDILDFSKLKNRDIVLNIKPVDIRQVAEVVIGVSKILAHGKNIEFVNSISPDCPLVYADENRLQQILYNLVGNAVKFTKEGMIQISAEPVFLNDMKKNMVKVSVADTGIGIPEDRYDDIFQSFEQLEASISREYGGTGLGLSITKKLVELQGGEIGLTSKLGEGSVFYFTLPSDPKTQEVNLDDVRRDVVTHSKIYLPEFFSANRDVPPRNLPNAIGKVLAVDDEIINLQVLDDFLTGCGFEVILAQNGFEALRILDEGCRPDIVLLDVMMPRMSGFEVCRKIREKLGPHQLPVLMLTAKTQTHDVIAGLEFGANDYVPKPFDRKELLARISTLISLKKAADHESSFLRLQNEMNAARQILLSTLPGKIPAGDLFILAVQYLPMSLVGGDYYDFNEMQTGKIGILLADVSGHGVPAAIIAGMVKMAFNTIRTAVHDSLSLVRGIHDTLEKNLEGQYVSLGYCDIDLEEGRLSYIRAGHLPLYIYRRLEGNVEEIKPPGRIIGWKCDFACEPVSVKLNPGDRIIFITDGLLEIRRKEGDLFGEERLKDFIFNNENLDCKGFSTALIGYILNWAEKHEGDDDMTLVVLDYLGK